MSWLQLVENPEAVSSVFDSEPSLHDVEVVSVIADRDGPTVTVETLLNQPPSVRSVRWERVGANAVSLKLQLLGVESLAIGGWKTENRAAIEISKRNGAIEVRISGPSTRIDCSCQWLRIAGIGGYRCD